MCSYTDSDRDGAIKREGRERERERESERSGFWQVII
jgi:hypothetical protein